MQQVPYWGPTNARRRSTKCSRNVDLAPGICASLLQVQKAAGDGARSGTCLGNSQHFALMQNAVSRPALSEGSPVRVLSAGIAMALSGSPHLLFLPTAARLHSFSPCAMVVPIDSITVQKEQLQKDRAWVHESRVTRFCTVAPNTCGPSLWTC